MGAQAPGFGEIQQAQGKHQATGQQPGQPVGHQTGAQNPGDGGQIQPQSGIQPVAHGHAADPGAQVEVEGVADEGDPQHLSRGQSVASVAASEQVEAGEQQVTGEHHAKAGQQGGQAVAAQRLPDLAPVHVTYQVEQQHDDHADQRYGEQPPQQAPTRYASAHGLPGPQATVCGVSGAAVASRGRWAGNQPTTAGKWRAAW